MAPIVKDFTCDPSAAKFFEVLDAITPADFDETVRLAGEEENEKDAKRFELPLTKYWMEEDAPIAYIRRGALPYPRTEPSERCCYHPFAVVRMVVEGDKESYAILAGSRVNLEENTAHYLIEWVYTRAQIGKLIKGMIKPKGWTKSRFTKQIADLEDWREDEMKTNHLVYTNHITYVKPGAILGPLTAAAPHKGKVIKWHLDLETIKLSEYRKGLNTYDSGRPIKWDDETWDTGPRKGELIALPAWRKAGDHNWSTVDDYEDLNKERPLPWPRVISSVLWGTSKDGGSEIQEEEQGGGEESDEEESDGGESDEESDKNESFSDMDIDDD